MCSGMIGFDKVSDEMFSGSAPSDSHHAFVSLRGGGGLKSTNSSTSSLVREIPVEDEGADEREAKISFFSEDLLLRSISLILLRKRANTGL